MSSCCVYRSIGGLGDLIQMRGLFANLRKKFDHITWACPDTLHLALNDHPFVDRLISSKGAPHPRRFDSHYDLTWPCHEWEMANKPNIDRNRLEIWADVCEIELEDTGAHFTFSEEEGKLIDAVRQAIKPTVVIQPRSASRCKSLTQVQQQELVKLLDAAGYYVWVTHTQPMPWLDGLPCTVWHGLDLRRWLCLLAGASCVVTCDTSAFHARGAMGGGLVVVGGPTHVENAGKFYADATYVQHAQELECGGPCHHWRACPLTSHVEKPCMTMLEMGEVVQAVEVAMEKEYRERFVVGV